MPRNFNIGALRTKLPRLKPRLGRYPNVVVRVVLGVLLAANLIAAAIVIKPWGGTPEDLERQLRALQTQVQQKRTAVATLRTVSSKVEKGRTEGDAFLKNYFLEERVTSSVLLSELTNAAKASKMKLKEHTFATEPIEGSADLSMLSINGNWEGTFADLMELIQQVDRSKRLMVMESLTAQPQQTGGILNVNLKLDLFLREAKAE